MKNIYLLILPYRLLILGVLLAFISGCATFQPAPIDKIPSISERIQSKTQDGVTVSVSVLSADESERAFGAPLATKGIQLVWLRIENMSDNQYLLLLNKIDRNYF